jgi:hypothetical protein
MVSSILSDWERTFACRFILAVLLASSICNEASADVIARFPIEVDGLHVTVPVTIHERQYRFVLSTGTSLTTFDERLKPLLGPRVLSDSPVASQPGTPNEPHLFAAPAARMGNLPMRLTHGVHCTNLQLVDFQRFDGSIGIDVLRSFIVQFDFEKQVVNFFSPDSQPQKDWGVAIPFEGDRGGLPLVGVKLGGTRIPVLLDTGGTVTGTISNDDHRVIGEQHFRATGLLMMSSPNGLERAAFLRVDDCKLGPFQNRDLVFITDQESRLGMYYLRRFTVTFDIRHRLVYFAPNRNFLLRDCSDIDGMVLWSQKRDGPLSVRWVLGEGDGIAQTAGIRSGDVILEIDGDNTNLLTRAEILRRLAVNFGRNVSLLVKRGEDKHSHVLPR